MKILIISSNTGGGHNMCADALYEIFESKGHDCVICDGMEFISDAAAKIASTGHALLYKHYPKLFDIGYEYADTHPDGFGYRTLFTLCSEKGAERMADYIKENDFNIAVSTHPLLCRMLSDASELCGKRLFTAFVATDYTCSPFVNEGNAELYFIPHSSLTEEFASKGVPEGRLRFSGIPVRRAFSERTARQDAARKLQLNPYRKHIVIAGGSVGCGPMKKIVDSVIEATINLADITVICGKNDALQQQLGKKYGNFPSIHIVGFTNDMPLYMDVADLYVTKAGGISTSEAMTKRVPMIFFGAVEGCEKRNSIFFSNAGCAVSGEGAEHIAAECARLLKDDASRSRMSEAYSEISADGAAEYICNCILEKS